MKLTCLGIESTAHTFGIGIAQARFTDSRAAVIAAKQNAKLNGEILANVIKQFTTKSGGIIPAEAADHHVDVCDVAIAEALSAAKIAMRDIDIVSFSQGPGIGHCLRVGAAAARTLSLVHKKPLVGVNHCISHLEIGKLLTAATDPVLLYVSGANTQVIAFEAGKYRIFGETLDMGVGNMLDQFARQIGIGFPGGPQIMKLAAAGKNYIELPYVVKGMDVSFGGILTNIRRKFDSRNYGKEDLCYSLQETVFAMLVEVAERALAHTGKSELLLGGGVACNTRLQEMCRIMCRERGARLYVPEKQFLVDNGAQISWLGILEYLKGTRTAVENSAILPYWRTDEV
ncbi:bifunctional N(6)-L-threonylcarbamoyladenine synthase/serine/threonine protein kinase [Candidatus Woesearchaeota archaeon]|nr:bifunctional N(6)-L-threonylcarbamoyladenine synthase/serine/threonine protein kinase [Candidatus Woesearchaeota archaeon]